MPRTVNFLHVCLKVAAVGILLYLPSCASTTHSNIEWISKAERSKIRGIKYNPPIPSTEVEKLLSGQMTDMEAWLLFIRYEGPESTKVFSRFLEIPEGSERSEVTERLRRRFTKN